MAIDPVARGRRPRPRDDRGVFWLHDLSDPVARPGVYDALFLLVGVLFLVPATIEYREHLRPVDRHEIEADVVLIAVALGSVLYLILRPVGSASLESISAAITAILVASTIGAYLALSMWLPTRAHIGLLVGIGTLAAGSSCSPSAGGGCVPAGRPDGRTAPRAVAAAPRGARERGPTARREGADETTDPLRTAMLTTLSSRRRASPLLPSRPPRRPTGSRPITAPCSSRSSPSPSRCGSS